MSRITNDVQEIQPLPVLYKATVHCIFSASQGCHDNVLAEKTSALQLIRLTPENVNDLHNTYKQAKLKMYTSIFLY